MKNSRPRSVDFTQVSGNGVAVSRGATLGGARSAVTSLDRWLLAQLMKATGEPAIRVKLWNDQVCYQPRAGVDAVGTLRIGDRGVLTNLLLAPELTFGDGFSMKRLEVDGNLVEFLETVYRSTRRAALGHGMRGLVARWLTRPRENSVFGSRENIHHHYDIGNDFYTLWLDEQMVYTCAYYERPDCTLEQAQVAKMEHVCRKLGLQPGQTVVEAGCGWGALARHMARHHGVTVKAYNISHQQVSYARERAAAEGLANRVEYVEDDYRNIQGSYDHFVSVGMLEHVGPANYTDLGRVIARVLRPQGRGLIHTIGRIAPERNNVWIERRIFPGSCPPSLRQMTSIVEPFGYAVLDVENLRLHYARTCHAWLERFDAVSDRVEQMFDENFLRAWRLYLAGSVAAFSTGSLQLFQMLFTHRSNNELPMTRHFIYGESDGPSS